MVWVFFKVEDNCLGNSVGFSNLFSDNLTTFSISFSAFFISLTLLTITFLAFLPFELMASVFNISYLYITFNLSNLAL